MAMRNSYGEREDVRRLILSAASRLFISSGIHGTSLSDIANAVGLSKGTLYYYYPAKENIVNEVFSVYSSHFSDVIFFWVDNLTHESDIRQELAKLIDAFLEDDDLARLHLVFATQARLDDESVREMLSQKLEEWAVMLEVGSIKMQSNEARALCSRSRLFFRLLTGLMTEDRVTDEEKADFIRLFVG